MYTSDRDNNFTEWNLYWNNNESNYNKDKQWDSSTNDQESDHASNDTFFDENDKISNIDKDNGHEPSNEENMN